MPAGPHAVVVALVILLLPPLVCAAGLNETPTTTEVANANNGVPSPRIPRGQGEHCVADTQFMRRNHMTLLMHQRDETVRQGIRGKQYSLQECINCHVVEGAQARPVTITSPQHFCRSCHDYAAVKIDCFECHASRPQAGLVAGEHGGNIAGVLQE